jgi:hypothetical protein
VTSLQKETGGVVDEDEVERAIVRHFADIFGRTLVAETPETAVIGRRT